MKPSVLRNLTWEEVKEVVNMADAIITPTSREFPVCWANEEDYYKEILRKLRGQNGVPPPIEERYPVVLQAAEQATSWMLTDSRERENTLIRQFVAYKMHGDGYSFSEIGKILKRDHSTIAHLCYRMRDMLSVPGAYKWEVQQFKRFEELLK